MGFISDIYDVKQTTPVATDKYHFTTAYAYWQEGRAENPSVFYMFGRKEALNGGYTIAGGLEGVIDIVKRWQEHGFSDEDIAFIRSQKTPSGKQQFPDEFLDYLKNMKFRLKIDAAPEGSTFFPQEPVLRVEGPIAQVKMLESVALGIVNGHSGYTTHAARLTDVLAKDLENGSPKGSGSVQGMRRGPGFGAMLEASRSLGLGGYTSTSTGTAARDFGQAFAGTMDHAWVMTHENEVGDKSIKELLALQADGKISEFRDALKKDAFRSFAIAHPESGILLVDTYDPLQGLENAIKVIKELHAEGLGKGYGVRFDSGDIVKYSKIALRRFAEEGLVEGLDPAKVSGMKDAELLTWAGNAKAFCAAADGIDEHTANEMREKGAFFKSWGVGTAGSHVSPLGLVYKASAVYMDVLDGQPMPEGGVMTPVMKVAQHAPVKSSNPGRINSRRFYDEDGKLAKVVIYDERLGLDPKGESVNLRDFKDHQTIVGEGKDLLVPVFDAKGDYVYQEPKQTETFKGSGKFVTDLGAMAGFVKEQLAALPEKVRMVVRPRGEVLKEKLAEAFSKAKKAGDTSLNINIADIEAQLPPEVQHIPVYLDKNLFDQRQGCEQLHASHTNMSGVEEYTERFEDKKPVATDVSGELKVQGGPEVEKLQARE